MDAEITRPLLRYFGGKWQLRSWIVDHLPEHEFYAEPFAGGASVLLAKPPASKGEILNDLNNELINLFRVMQDLPSAEELMRRLDWTPYSQAEFQLAREETSNPIERARRMVVRSFMGIETAGVIASGTGFRMGNVDLRRLDESEKRTFRNCAKDWSNWKDVLPLISQRLRHVMIYQRDALEFIDLMDSPDCLLYVDPPYHPDTRSGTRYEVEFTHEQHVQLVERLLSAKAMVVLSGYACDVYKALEQASWIRVDKEYRANMSDERRMESLWINAQAAHFTHQMLKFD